MTLEEAAIRNTVRRYITTNFVLDTGVDLDDTSSLLDAGILDSTGAVEMVAFLQHTFAIDVGDEDMVADNLDSVERISRFVLEKSERPGLVS